MKVLEIIEQTAKFIIAIIPYIAAYLAGIGKKAIDGGYKRGRG